jgi:zinc protease
LTIDQLDEFFKANIADKTYTYLVIGKKEDVNFDVLRSLGEVQELTLEDVFGE